MSRFYLARRTGLREIELVDGGHDDQSGVEKAVRVFKRVYSDEGPWVMVNVMDVPVADRRTGEMKDIVETEALFEQLRAS